MKICIVFFIELWANMTFNPLFATSTQKGIIIYTDFISHHSNNSTYM